MLITDIVPESESVSFYYLRLHLKDRNLATYLPKGSKPTFAFAYNSLDVQKIEEF